MLFLNPDKMVKQTEQSGIAHHEVPYSVELLSRTDNNGHYTFLYAILMEQKSINRGTVRF